MIEDIQNCMKSLKEIVDNERQKKNLTHIEIDKIMNEFEEKKKIFNNLKNEFYYSIQVLWLYIREKGVLIILRATVKLIIHKNIILN